MTRALEAEGVRKVVVCAEDPKRYGRQARWAAGVRGASGATGSREVQDELRRVPGVTVIVYDQRCAAEARRLRKQRPARGAAAPRRDQRGGVRGLRRLQHQEQLPLGAAARHRVRREAPDPRLVVQPRLHVPRGRLPLVRHDHRQAVGRRATPAGRAPSDVAARRCPTGDAAAPAARRRSTGSTASTSPASAAPAWSPPTGSSPPRPRRPGYVVGGHGPDRPVAEGRRRRLAPAPGDGPRARSARPRWARGGADLYLSGDILQAAGADPPRRRSIPAAPSR